MLSVRAAHVEFQVFCAQVRPEALCVSASSNARAVTAQLRLKMSVVPTADFNLSWICLIFCCPTGRNEQVFQFRMHGPLNLLIR